MAELIEILDALESKGWVCLMKWDGERSSKAKTVVVQKSGEARVFRGDFSNFNQALDQLRTWIDEQGILTR